MRDLVGERKEEEEEEDGDGEMERWRDEDGWGLHYLQDLGSWTCPSTVNKGLSSSARCRFCW